jgi:CBS domain-containing protein
MKIKEIMTREVEVIHPTDSLQTAAQKMRDRDVGLLPIYDGNQLTGVITDRDLIVRAIAAGMDPRAMFGRELMTSPVIFCYEDQDVEEAARMMHENQIRRLLILNRADQHLVGVLSLGDLAVNSDDKVSAKVLHGVSE